MHEVEVTACFVSRYELTQGQWRRIAGTNPSEYGPEGKWSPRWRAGEASPSLLHPVEQISWLDCMTWLPRAGLELPSEALWEFACRAGSDTIWWSGSDEENLIGVANLADRYAQTHGGAEWQWLQPWLDDGSTVHAPVGTYVANPFGLHEMHGNVWEWCADGYDSGFYARGPRKDPRAPHEGLAMRIRRGGSFYHSAVHARAAIRGLSTPSNAGFYLGVRPARPIAD